MHDPDAGASPTTTRGQHEMSLYVQLQVAEALEPRMESRLRHTIPELKWEDLAENWGKIRIAGTLREPPHDLVVCVSRAESPGPFKLHIWARHTRLEEARAFHWMTLARVQMALRSRLVDTRIDLVGSIQPPARLFYSFQSSLSLPPDAEPRMALRIQKAIPELNWINEAPDWDQTRIVGNGRESSAFTAVFITREQSSGPYDAWIHLTAKSFTDATLTRETLLGRIRSAAVAL